jgi:hypothetical protein
MPKLIDQICSLDPQLRHDGRQFLYVCHEFPPRHGIVIDRVGLLSGWCHRPLALAMENCPPGTVKLSWKS